MVKTVAHYFKKFQEDTRSPKQDIANKLRDLKIVKKEKSFHLATSLSKDELEDLMGALNRYFAEQKLRVS